MTTLSVVQSGAVNAGVVFYATEVYPGDIDDKSTALTRWIASNPGMGAKQIIAWLNGWEMDNKELAQVDCENDPDGFESCLTVWLVDNFGDKAPAEELLEAFIEGFESNLDHYGATEW
ncbi:MAG: hypothetical protein CMH98_11160 [Oceanospirillaceae bacterium]|nr:hypothetical protein [Oceanospirillaceae bacterium]